MRTWVALLRGVNVGGARKIRMAELRELCSSLGFESVATYIQSGNVVFRAREGDPGAVAGKVATAIEGAFGFDVAVMVRNVDQLASVVEGNPFLAEGVEDTSRLHVTFLSAAPAASVRKAFGRYRIGRDELRLVGREAYLHTPEGMGRSKLTPAFMERSFDTASTTRNWRTVNTLLEMARGL
jgi:uncharacterized protein (DUF1697 family)